MNYTVKGNGRKRRRACSWALISLARARTARVAGGKAEEGVRLRLHFFREVFGNLADAAPHGPEPRQGADVADFDADALAALGLQRFGAHLPDHAPGVEEAVVGGQAGQLVKDVAGDQKRDALLPVQL